MPERRFFRIVQGDSPTALDFTSNAAKGIPSPAKDPETMRLWTGISVYDRRGYARRLALRALRLGRFVAELRLPDDASAVIERTTRSHGHDTLWGEPATLRTYVIAVTPVDEAPDHERGEIQ
jgi:hypothetical protein